MPEDQSSRSFSRFVALGDSQTEGIGDPDGAGGCRGWADRLATRLAASAPEVRYANLAVRGKRAAQIRAEQLAVALDLRPDLAAVVAGMNDLIRPRFDRDAVLGDIEAMVTALTGVGARVFTFTFPDIGGVAPIVRPLSGRVREVNRQLRELARRHRILLIDFEPVGVTTDPRVWAEDRLHLNPLGHDLVARAVAEALGLPGADSDWRRPLPPLQLTLSDTVVGEFRWATRHMAPWVGRRLRGVSSGAGITAKRPELLPVRTCGPHEVADHHPA